MDGKLMRVAGPPDHGARIWIQNPSFWIHNSSFEYKTHHFEYEIHHFQYKMASSSCKMRALFVIFWRRGVFITVFSGVVFRSFGVCFFCDVFRERLLESQRCFAPVRYWVYSDVEWCGVFDRFRGGGLFHVLPRNRQEYRGRGALSRTLCRLSADFPHFLLNFCILCADCPHFLPSFCSLSAWFPLIVPWTLAHSGETWTTRRWWWRGTSAVVRFLSTFTVLRLFSTVFDCFPTVLRLFCDRFGSTFTHRRRGRESVFERCELIY